MNTVSDLPKVCVLCGCFNHAEFVKESLESIKAQTYKNIQLIIWDDFSKDESVSIIKEWIKEYKSDCIFLQNSSNLGICKSLNKALHLAKGDFIAVIAADDVWLPDKIHNQVDIMQKSSQDIGVVYSDAFKIDEKGNQLPGMFIQTYRNLLSPPEGYIFDFLYDGNFIPAMATLVRTKCYECIGTYDEELAFEDWDMWLRISKSFRFVYDPIPSAKYRLVSTSLSHTMSDKMCKTAKNLKLKQHFNNGLNENQSNEALSCLCEVAWDLYQSNKKIPITWQFALLKREPSFKIFFLLTCYNFRFRFINFLRLLKFFVRSKAFFKGAFLSQSSKSFFNQ